MELDELKSAWKSNDLSLNKRVGLREDHLEKIGSRKVEPVLGSILRQRVVECAFHLTAIVLLAVFLVRNLNELPYAVSAVVLLAFYAATLVSAARQIRLINSMDFAGDLSTVQSSLLKLQTHIVSYVKMAVLFIPTFLAYPAVVGKVIRDLDVKMFAGLDRVVLSTSWWTAQFWMYIVFVPLGIWFFQEVSYRNIDKAWVRRFVEKSTGKRVVKALELLKELQDAK